MKYFLPLILTIVVNAATARTFLGLEAGANISRYKYVLAYNYYHTEPKSAAKAGLRAGVILDISIGRYIALQPGVFYSSRSGRLTHHRPDERELTIHYLEIPVMLFYTLHVRHGRVMAGVGPQVAIALNGRDREINYSTLIGYSDATSSMKIGKGSGRWDKLDFGANISAGYQFDIGMYIKLGYSMGFANYGGPDNYLMDAKELKNRAVMITLGYILKEKNK
jgi:hypothetical protein